VNRKVIDWAQYSDEDIARFLGELASVREQRKADKRNALKAQIEEMLKEQGLNLDEVFARVGKGRGRPKGKPKAEERLVKYRNTAEPSQTWTGMGRKPGWLVEALAAGRTLEEFVA
jgi:DNA-binding protein H-NS